MNLSFDGDVSSTFHDSLAMDGSGKRRTTANGIPRHSKRPRTQSEPPRRGGLFGHHLNLAGLSLAAGNHVLTNESILETTDDMNDSSRLSVDRSFHDGPRPLQLQLDTHNSSVAMTDDSASSLDEFSERLRDVSSRSNYNNSTMLAARRGLPPRGHSTGSSTLSSTRRYNYSAASNTSIGDTARPLFSRVRRGNDPDRL